MRVLIILSWAGGPNVDGLDANLRGRLLLSKPRG